MRHQLQWSWNRGPRYLLAVAFVAVALEGANAAVNDARSSDAGAVAPPSSTGPDARANANPPVAALPSMPARARAAGAALRAALDASEHDIASAHTQLETLRAEHPTLRDLSFTAEAIHWLERGDTVRAESAAGQGLAAAPSSGLRAPLEAVRARSAVAVGAEALARAAWERASQNAAGRDERATYRLALGESYERSGERDAAVAAYRELWIRLPTTPAARTAGERLDELEREPGVTARSAADALARADRLFEARRSAAALAAYKRAQRGSLRARDRRHVAMRHALSLFRTRSYPEAVKAFSKIPGAEARFWRARALARAGRVEEAIDLFEAIAGDPKARRGPWARYLAAILHEGRGRHDVARQQFRKVLARGGDLGRSARWRLAWRDYLEGRFGEARNHLRRLAKGQADPIDRLRPRYWAARALEAEDPARAAAELRAIAREYPLTYYALQARRVLGESSIEAVPNRVAADPRQLGDDVLFRVRVALVAGETELARRLLRELRPRAKRIRDRLALAELYHAAGDSYPALQLVVVPYSGLLARGIDPEIPELWEAAWPRPFESLVNEWTPAGLERSVVWSVMREESGFRVAVESITGALGLLQIQPKTGERLANAVGLDPFEPERLTEPAVNVRLGAFYLHNLTGEFGVLPPALASYNAGEHAVRTWIDAEDDPESDVWIESIPYTQTRNYVKRVLRNLTYYRALEAAQGSPSGGDRETAPGEPASRAPAGQKAERRTADNPRDEAAQR